MCQFFKALAKLFTIIKPARLGYQRLKPRYNTYTSITNNFDCNCFKAFAKMSDGQLTTLKNHVAGSFIFLSQEPIGQLISARESP